LICDGFDYLRRCDEIIPCLAAGTDDSLVIFIDPMSGSVLALILDERLCCVPSSPVDDDNGMDAGCDFLKDFHHVLVHGRVSARGMTSATPTPRAGQTAPKIWAQIKE
jgi:hypothetical protein